MANATRTARAGIKAGLRAGTLSLDAALRDAWTQTMPVIDLLRSLPRWGDQRARRALREAGASEFRRVGELTERQRAVLAAEAE